MQDTLGSGRVPLFRSAHAAGFNMALCDRSVHFTGCIIDGYVHQRLANRKDGRPVDKSQF